MVKTDTAKLARVAEDESARSLLQHKMVIFSRLESFGLDPQFAAHPEVNPEPVIVGEFKKHLFAAGL
jgi:hypothetical protein